MFDALIANGDRHDKNWAVLRRPDAGRSQDALCSSYDHASSLGFNIRAGDHASILAEGSVRRWANRGWARQFEHSPGGRHVSLVDLACSALRLCSAGTSRHWLDRVAAMEAEPVRSILGRASQLVPEPVLEFMTQLLRCNRGRLLDATRE